jgi:hypothetical protein
MRSKDPSVQKVATHAAEPVNGLPVARFCGPRTMQAWIEGFNWAHGCMDAEAVAICWWKNR